MKIDEFRLHIIPNYMRRGLVDMHLEVICDGERHVRAQVFDCEIWQSHLEYLFDTAKREMMAYFKEKKKVSEGQ